MIYDPIGYELMFVMMNDRNLVVNWNSIVSDAYARSVDMSSLRHRRMDHVNYHSLIHLQKHELVLNLPPIYKHDDVCEVCQLGKQSSFSFPANQAWRESEKIQLVHTDVCGPVNTCF